MVDLRGKLGVMSFVLRHWMRPDELIARTKEAGLFRIELWSGHFNRNDQQRLEEITSPCKEKGVKVTALGILPLTRDEESQRKLFELGKIAGVPVLSVDFPIDSVPESFPIAEKLAAEFDVNLAVHVEGGVHWLSNREALEWIFRQTGPRVGLCLDTGWFIDARQDPVEIARLFGDRLYNVHLKDFIYRRERKPVDVVLGEGLLDVPGVLGVLEEINYEGPVSLEYEGDKENPVPALKRCVQAVERNL